MGDVDDLRGLAATYARAVDRRDGSLLASVFAVDAVLEVYDPATAAEPTGVRRGHPELAAIADAIARFDRTFHLVGQSHYEVDGDVATGEVYCAAHHLSRSAEGDTDMVMFIRYDDRYARGADGRWCIARRRVLVDWRETRSVRG